MNNSERQPVENEFLLLHFILLRSVINHEIIGTELTWGRNLPVVSVTEILDAIGVDLALYDEDELERLNYLPSQMCIVCILRYFIYGRA